MGFVVSKHADLSEFSVATGIIGLVSFGFTLGTFFKVVWVNLQTIGEAPHEVHGYLTTLRTELLEEQTNLRTMRKGLRKYQRQRRREGRDVLPGHELDNVSLRTIGDSIKTLIKRFRALEKPFLEKGERGIFDAPNHRTRSRRRNDSLSPPYYSHAAYASSPPEKDGGGRTHTRNTRGPDRERDPPSDNADEEAADDAYWAQRTKYAHYTLLMRFRWLTRKSEAQDLFDSLSRVQIRRTALQVGGIAIGVHAYGCDILTIEDTVRRIDERVSRVMGVRRVDQ